MKRIKGLVVATLLVASLLAPLAAQAAVNSRSCYWWNWWLCSAPNYLIGPNSIVGPNGIVTPNN
jgi:hypothetical protein